MARRKGMMGDDKGALLEEVEHWENECSGLKEDLKSAWRNLLEARRDMEALRLPGKES